MELNLSTTQCVLNTNICAIEGIPLLKKFAAANGLVVDDHIIETLKEYLHVSSEHEIWKHSKVRRFVDDKIIDRIHKLYFKLKGPATSTKLLSNNDIDGVLTQWAYHSIRLFDKKLKHYNFHMADFLEYNTDLSKIDFKKDIFDAGYNCMCVVFNTDVSNGYGKHWLCVYGDFKHQGTKEDPHILEYFNSSGRKMMESVHEWMVMHKAKLEKQNIYMNYVYPFLSRRIQKSNTECGMWSLIYIRSRLENKSPTFFIDKDANDNDMIKYRRFVFSIH